MSASFSYLDFVNDLVPALYSICALVCTCVCLSMYGICGLCSYMRRVCAQVREPGCVCIIPFFLCKRGYAACIMFFFFLLFLILAKESKTRPSIFSVMYPLNQRMDATEGGSPHLPCDYSVWLTACSHGAEIRGNNTDEKNAGLLIYYSQIQCLNQYAYTPIGS